MNVSNKQLDVENQMGLIITNPVKRSEGLFGFEVGLEGFVDGEGPLS